MHVANAGLNHRPGPLDEVGELPGAELCSIASQSFSLRRIALGRRSVHLPLGGRCAGAGSRATVGGRGTRAAMSSSRVASESGSRHGAPIEVPPLCSIRLVSLQPPRVFIEIAAVMLPSWPRRRASRRPRHWPGPARDRVLRGSASSACSPRAEKFGDRLVRGADGSMVLNQAPRGSIRLMRRPAVAIVRTPFACQKPCVLPHARPHRLEALPGVRRASDLPGEPLPAHHRDIDVGRVELDARGRCGR